jgi:hypothetical protein
LDTSAGVIGKAIREAFTAVYEAVVEHPESTSRRYAPQVIDNARHREK